MQTLGRLAAILVTITLSAVPAAALAAPSAPARAGTSWTTIATSFGAKHQACKAIANGGDAWRVKNRLVNGNAGKVGAGMTVTRNGKNTDRTWNSGLIAKNTTSEVGSVLLPRGDQRFGLVRFEYVGQAGDGGPIGIRDIGRC